MKSLCYITFILGCGKIVQKGQTKPKQGYPCLGLPEGVQEYVERRSLFIA